MLTWIESVQSNLWLDESKIREGGADVTKDISDVETAFLSFSNSTVSPKNLKKHSW